MESNDTIYTLHDDIEQRKSECEALSKKTADFEARKALNEVKKELSDLDSHLAAAEFIKNNSRIAELTNQIQTATIAGDKFLSDLRDLDAAIKKVTAKLNAFNTQVEQAKPQAEALVQSVDDLVDLLRGNRKLV